MDHPYAAAHAAASDEAPINGELHHHPAIPPRPRLTASQIRAATENALRRFHDAQGESPALETRERRELRDHLRKTLAR